MADDERLIFLIARSLHNYALFELAPNTLLYRVVIGSLVRGGCSSAGHDSSAESEAQYQAEKAEYGNNYNPSGKRLHDLNQKLRR